MDTAGQDEFSAMGEQYMRTGDGFMLVYSVTDKQSYENIANFHTQILQVKDGDSCPMLLVANKVDLVHFRKITTESGKEMAQKLGARYIETSAKDPPLNVDAAFHEVTKKYILKQYNYTCFFLMPYIIMQVVRLIRNQMRTDAGTNRKKRSRFSKCVLL